jgi:short-chain fatty acids transporter
MAEPPPTFFERVGRRFSDAAERFVPDAFVFALLATFLVLGAGVLATPTPAHEVVTIWGKGYWDLLPFTLQMALVVITGYVLATAPVVHRGIAWLAARPRTGHGAVAFVAFCAMASSWLNWGFSLMFSAMLAREVARRVPSADYRTLAAASFLGLGSIWAQGLSGSAALQMATPGALPPAIRDIVARRGPDGAEIAPGGLVPLSETIFLWQSLLAVVIEIAVVVALVYLAAPRGARARSAAALGIDLGPSPGPAHGEHAPAAGPPPPEDPARSPARSVSERLERSPVLSWLFVAVAGTYLALHLRAAPSPLAAIDLNTLNLAFLTLGTLLHRTPARLMAAVRDATPATWGIVLQFPLYAGIAAVISRTHLSEAIAGLFTRVSTPESYPALIAAYSAVLGVFVPSGGSKWVIEAPYVMQAAHELRVHLGWMVACYDLGEALANLVQPFWMLPILALFRLRARDVMGTTFLVAVVLTPLVLVLVTVLGATLTYPR